MAGLLARPRTAADSVRSGLRTVASYGLRKAGLKKKDPVTRGQVDRDATAAQLATASYPDAGSAHVVVLARDDVYADALTGSPLAVTLDGPVLLTPTARLSTSAAGAIQSVLPRHGLVICLGGVNAISAGVVAQLQALGYQVQRIGGADRYATATLIADRITSAHAVSKVYLATGQDFADALPAADAAGLTNGVVLLTAGAQLPAVAKAWLAAHPNTSTTAIGGSAASAAPGATPIVGGDRYATAAKVAATTTAASAAIAAYVADRCASAHTMPTTAARWEIVAEAANTAQEWSGKPVKASPCASALSRAAVSSGRSVPAGSGAPAAERISMASVTRVTRWLAPWASPAW